MPIVLLAVSAPHQAVATRTSLAVAPTMRSLVHPLVRIRYVSSSRPPHSSFDPFLQSPGVASPVVTVETIPRPAEDGATEARPRLAM